MPVKPASPIQQIRDTVGDRMARLKIDERDLSETFTRSSGPGGQNVNKVSTSVTLRWGEYEVSVQDSRSQAMNRQIARLRLCDAVEMARRQLRLERQAAASKKRALSGKRPRGVKERILASKRRRSESKKRRQSGGGDFE